jgi:hypothetical protein
MKTIEERVNDICKWTNESLRLAVEEAMNELAKDQTKACADALDAHPKSTFGQIEAVKSARIW